MTDAPADERIDRLRSVPIFSQLGDTALGRVLDIATEFEVGTGHVLVRPDQPGTGLFVIEEGTVVVEAPRGDIALGEGEFLGELALLSQDAVHAARAHATTPVRCLAIGRDDFDDLIESEPTIAVSMLRVLAHRLWESTRS